MIAEQLNSAILAIVLMPVMWINAELMLYVRLGSIKHHVLAHKVTPEILEKHVTQVSVLHLDDTLEMYVNGLLKSTNLLLSNVK